MEDQLRPEFLQAVGAASWNWWFWLAYAAPFLIIVPASARRWAGWMVAPVAFALCWFTYAKAIDVYDAAFEKNAVTRREWNAVGADTGRTLAPILRGTPISFVLTLIALAVGRAVRRCIDCSRQATSVSSAVLTQAVALPTAEPDRNPYTPPRNSIWQNGA